MGIVQLPLPIAANSGVLPNIKTMATTDNLATITTAGYMNSVNLEGYPLATTDELHILYSFNTVTNVGTLGIFTVSISNGIITLVEDVSEGNVVLPTIANHIATYVGTNGQISEDPATAISGGNIQAGLSGTAGTLASFPSAGSKGSLKVAAVANTNNDAVTISNAVHAQASVYSIPDGGQATSNFITSNNATTQTIATGSLALTVGNVTTTAGNIQAGSSGHAGTLSSFSSTGSKGSLKVAAVANTNDDITTVSNAAMGQASVISIPDPANALGRFMVGATATPFVSGNIPVASGTGGLFVDSGLVAANYQPLTASVTMTAAQVNGSYAAPFVIVATPGANKALVVISVAIVTQVAAAFADGGVAKLQYGATVHGAGLSSLDNTIPAAEITAATSQLYSIYGLPTTTVTATSAITNLGLYFSNATGAFTGGAGSTVSIVVQYMVVPAS